MSEAQMSMKEQLERLVREGRIRREHVKPLLDLLQAGYGLHRSWGAGRIQKLDPTFGRLIIDFADRKGHVMDLRMAARTLQPIPMHHILVRKLEELERLRTLAEENPKELVRLAIESYPEGISIDRLREVLVPEVVPEAEWKPWWDRVRQELRADQRFHVPRRRSEPLTFSEVPIPPEQRLLDQFVAAKGLRAKLRVVREAIQSWGRLTDPGLLAGEVIGELNREIPRVISLDPALALTAVFMRDELRRRAGGPPPEEGETTVAMILDEIEDPVAVLQALPQGRYQEAVQSILDHAGEKGWELLLQAMERGNVRLCGECVDVLIKIGRGEELRRWVLHRIENREASSDLLAYLLRSHRDWLFELPGDRVIFAVLNALEREKSEGARNLALENILLQEPELIADLMEELDPETIEDLTQALLHSSAFEAMDRQSLAVHLAKRFPFVEAQVSAASVRKGQEKLWVSRESYYRKQKALEEIVNHLIPEAARQVEEARKLGDLRENHEYKAAREHLALLHKQRIELERDLATATPIDFGHASTNEVGLGTTVTLLELDTNLTHQVSILGAWDLDEERGIISYLSPLAQAMLGRKVGETIEVEVDIESRRYRIEKIEPYQPRENLSTVHADEQGAAEHEPAVEETGSSGEGMVSQSS